MSPILKTRAFSRLAAKFDIPDAALKKAVEEMRAGLIDANLGGNVYKKRVAVGNRGKSGGSRTIIATNLNDRWYFLHCYLKKNQADLSPADEEDFKALAHVLLSLSEAALRKVVLDGNLEEIP